MGPEQWVVDECLTRIRGLEAVRAVEFRGEPGDGVLTLRTGLGRLSYTCEVKRGLSRARLQHALLQLRARTSKRRTRLLVLTDFLPWSLTDLLVASDTDFVDAAGNMLLRWPSKLYVRITGAKPVRPAEVGAGLLTTPTGLRVIFALLADGRNEVAPYRTVAERAGVALASVARVATELRRRGFLEIEGNAGRWLRRRRDLVELWVGGYAERLRPRLVVGRFQSPERDPGNALVTFASHAQAERVEWALTGGFAADLLTGHYRGDQLVLFVEPWSGRLASAVRWLPSAHGSLVVLRPFWPRLAERTMRRDGSPLAHPLLVYAELVFQGQERDLETAKLVYDRYLAHLVGDA